MSHPTPRPHHPPPAPDRLEEHHAKGLDRDGDRLGIDGIRFAWLPCDPASLTHQLRGHAKHLLSGAQQVTFEPSGDVPAVLDSEDDLVELLSLGQQPQVTISVCADRDLA